MRCCNCCRNDLSRSCDGERWIVWALHIWRKGQTSRCGIVYGTFAPLIPKCLILLSRWRTLPPPTDQCIQKSSFCWRSRRLTCECAGEKSHSVLNEHSAKDAPTLERRIGAS